MLMQRGVRDRDVKNQAMLVTLLAFGVLTLLYMELQRQLSSRSHFVGERKPVATLKTRIKSVQRKFDKEVLWENVSLSEALFNKDAIRTDAESEAKILFEDGTELELSENSLVILDRSDEKIGIQFLKGSVFAKSNGTGASSLEIQTKDGKVKVGDQNQKGALSLRSGAQGLEVTVEEGQAHLQTTQGATALGVNERGKLDQNGVKKEFLTVFLKTPAAATKFITLSKTQIIPFDWDLKGVEKRATLEISKDADFKELVFEGSEQKRTAQLIPGSYYWRVRTKSEVSDVRKFKILKHTPVRLETPADATQYSAFKNSKNIRFSWGSGTSYIGGVDRLEVSKDSEFQNPILVKDIRSESSNQKNENRYYALLENLPQGEYFWRVVSQYDGIGLEEKETFQATSSVRRFSKMILNKLPAPELLEPPMNSVLGLSEKTKSVRFTWSPVEEAFGYRIKVAADPQFENLILNTFTPSSSWEGELNVTGNLYWTVQSVMTRERSDDDSVFAKPKRFSLNREGGFKLVSPKTNSYFEYLADKPEIIFEWEKVGGAQKYEFQVSFDQNFKSITYSKVVSLTKYENTDLPAGNLFWRVKALDEGAQPISLSEIGKFQLKEKALLEAPEKLIPDPSTVVELDASTGDEKKFLFSWKEVKDTKEYFFTIQKLSASKKYEDFYNKYTTAFQLERALEEGSYQWDVRAIDQVKRLGQQGTPRSIEIKQSDKLAAPQIEAPAHQALIEDTEVKSVTLKWGSVDGASRYRVHVYQVQSNGSKVLLKTIETDKTKYKLPESLKTGNYLWEVAAFGVAPGSKSKTASVGKASASEFSLKWIGVLDAPTKIKFRMEVDRMPASQKKGTK